MASVQERRRRVIKLMINGYKKIGIGSKGSCLFESIAVAEHCCNVKVCRQLEIEERVRRKNCAV